MGRNLVLCLALSVAALACQEEVIGPDPEVDLRDEFNIGQVPANPQVEGDPEEGYRILIGGEYVRCGIPKTLTDALPGFTQGESLPGREGDNEGVAYSQAVFTNRDGVKMVGTNCLTCHAGYINGELIVGLGDTQFDYTSNPLDLLDRFGDVLDLVITDPLEKAALDRFLLMGQALAPFSQTAVIGVNPAESITAGIFAHLDPQTLEWSEAPLLEVPAAYRDQVSGLSVPPWWWLKKKHNMFYTTAGSGDLINWSMLFSTVCAEDVEDARQISELFPHILAYIRSIEPPAYPWDIDRALAQEGESVFEANCARCHGTYGEDWTYPNLAVSVDEVGTDRGLADLMFGAEVFHQWIEDSFFGGESIADPALGYIAPPLDGIWATAPFLHNSSVPTLAALLDSSARPTCWSRTFDSNDYNPDDLGWNYTETHCQDAEEDDAIRPTIYDTTLPGYSKAGHTFGDALVERERRALMEYLKTL